jgi:hypothetical protein
MPALVAGTHVLRRSSKQGVGGRDAVIAEAPLEAIQELGIVLHAGHPLAAGSDLEKADGGACPAEAVPTAPPRPIR